MKRNLICFSIVFSLFLVVNISAQTTGYNLIFDKAEKRSIAEYQLFPRQLKLEMPYAKYKIIDKSHLTDIKVKEIKQVHLVYTKHPINLSIEKLNRKRLHTLYRIAPELFNNPDIKWTIIDQYNCPNKAVAESLYHGFTFSYKKEGLFKKIIYQHNINKVREKYLSIPKYDRKFLSLGKDSLSYEVIARNANKWVDVTIVSDWTASMYPYTTQMLRWHLANNKSSNIQNFVFFNDGDNKAQTQKIIGKTGGLYAINADDFEKVIEVMKYARMKGTGNDLPENDIEALIFAQEKYPDSKELVLIADNKSAIRDVELLEQVKKPVHIILGRIFRNKDAFINRLYIKVALKTKGSLHTLTNDYYTKTELEDLKTFIDKERAKVNHP